MTHKQIHKSISFLDIIWDHKFLLVFYILIISSVSFVALYATGAVPEEFKVLSQDTDIPATTTPNTATTTATTSKKVELVDRTGELPERIVIKKIGLNAAVANPSTTDTATLNKYLLMGAVRYPGSGMLGKGNVFMFGHSSHLAIVNNQAYKAFNDLEDLNPGDVINVYSQKKIYTYKVFSVSLVDSDKELVDFKTTKNILTLSTCNVFGEKQERYVVEAEYVGSTNR